MLPLLLLSRSLLVRFVGRLWLCNLGHPLAQGMVTLENINNVENADRGGGRAWHRARPPSSNTLAWLTQFSRILE